MKIARMIMEALRVALLIYVFKNLNILRGTTRPLSCVNVDYLLNL